MYVAVQHTINDPERFWQTAEKEIPNLPGNLKVVSSYPSPDGNLTGHYGFSGFISHAQY